MDRIKVAVIGCTGVGRLHAQGTVGVEGAELVAGCDLVPEVLEEFKKACEGADPALYTDYREMLEREQPDVVTVATSDHRHAELVIDAAGAGARGVFCEKPMATSLADADRMLAACEANGTVLSVDHTRRFTPLWKHLKQEVVQGGAIGELQYVVGVLSGQRAALFRNGTHVIDALCYLADGRPQWVFAELEKGYEDYMEYRGDGGHDLAMEPAASGYIHFENDVRAFYTSTSKKTAGPKFRFEIVGSEGIVKVEDKATLCTSDGLRDIEIHHDHSAGIPAGVRELIEVVANGGEVSSPGRDAHAVVEVIFGFLESQRQGNRRVELPLPR